MAKTIDWIHFHISGRIKIMINRKILFSDKLSINSNQLGTIYINDLYEINFREIDYTRVRGEMRVTPLALSFWSTEDTGILFFCSPEMMTVCYFSQTSTYSAPSLLLHKLPWFPAVWEGRGWTLQFLSRTFFLTLDKNYANFLQKNLLFPKLCFLHSMVKSNFFPYRIKKHHSQNWTFKVILLLFHSLRSLKANFSI